MQPWYADAEPYGSTPETYGVMALLAAVVFLLPVWKG